MENYCLERRVGGLRPPKTPLLLRVYKVQNFHKLSNTVIANLIATITVIANLISTIATAIVLIYAAMDENPLSLYKQHLLKNNRILESSKL